MRHPIRVVCLLLLWTIAVFTQDTYLVKRVIDGDTFELAGGTRVRLIGVDTPETKHPFKPVEAFGQEAYDFTRKLIEGKRVKLEFDVQERDRYGRLLAYVYLEDGTFVNAELVKQGYARVATYPPNVKYSELFVTLQRQARENHRGLWGEEKRQLTASDDTVYVTRSGRAYHRDGCRYLSKSKIPLPLEVAAERYVPCGVCKPPLGKATPREQPADDITVYVTKSGHKYHRAGCRHLRRSAIPIPLSQAKHRYSPCSVCRPPH